MKFKLLEIEGHVSKSKHFLYLLPTVYLTFNTRLKDPRFSMDMLVVTLGFWRIVIYSKKYTQFLEEWRSSEMDRDMWNSPNVNKEEDK